MPETEIAPAKINLAQDILYRRTDNYHEVEMVMASIDLSDYLTFKLVEEDVITVETSRAFLPEDGRNHAYQAAKLLKEIGNIQTGVHIFIEKHIPVSAGLGGGSTDAAAVLRALNRLWHLHLTVEELLQLAAKIGSDVAYSVIGGTALVKGRGEIIEPLPDVPQCWVILAKPAISVSTRKIFSRLQVENLHYQPNAPRVISALEKHDFNALMAATGNSLEQVTFNYYPMLPKLKEKMIQFGAEGVTMSGSGPTVIGFTQIYRRGQRICNSLRGFCDEVYMVRILNEPFINIQDTTHSDCQSS